MTELLKIEDRYYILATSSRTDGRTLVLKHGDTFGVFDAYGDISPIGLGEQGLYHGGTRHLSRLEFRLGGSRPLLLSSAVTRENDLLTVDLTNSDQMDEDGTVRLPRDTLHVHRTKFLWERVCYERFRVTNHGLVAHTVEMAIEFDADFADVFEVRGFRRARRGTRRPLRASDRQVTLSYLGLDSVDRHTDVTFSLPQTGAGQGPARWTLALSPQSVVELTMAAACGVTAEAEAYDEALHKSRAALDRARRRRCRISTSSIRFDEWLNRSTADLDIMISETPSGPYPHAGVPWFSTPFGRDGIITAFEVLWPDPAVARGVLDFLAATQATDADAPNDGEPGKILHETRTGELAALGEIPFGRYYGTVDATPLFVALVGAYYQRTADRDLVERLWPHVERALDWIDRHGDRDGDGFVEYERHSADGLVHQGWKDSSDSVFHADGSLAAPPIALCEVQGYVYEAKRQAAALAALLGLDRAERLRAEAEELRRRFEEAFWCDEIGMYALALDGDKRPCRVRSSNAGQCLFSGIASPERARHLAAQLFGKALFSGWGIRTVAASERRYNPMSYHNGSVWPHDNAMIAAGLARYGMTDLAARLLTAFFDVSQLVDLRRMPELFCGFSRREGEGPTRYPVACQPQAWAAGAATLMLQSALGLSIDAPNQRVTFSRAVLPAWLDTVQIEHLAVADVPLDLVVHRYPHDVGVGAMGRHEGVEVVVIK